MATIARVRATAMATVAAPLAKRATAMATVAVPLAKPYD